MQITNILRDVREDFQMGRVYLPDAVLQAHGWDADRLGQGMVDEGFRELMRELIALARVYYQRGERGLPYLSADARFAIRVASRCYAGILRRIEQADYDVFRERAHVSGGGKLRIAVSTVVRPRIRCGALPPLPPGAPSGDDLIQRVGGLPCSAQAIPMTPLQPATGGPTSPSA
jgi:15-cis-phytoene synthase